MSTRGSLGSLRAGASWLAPVGCAALAAALYAVASPPYDLGPAAWVAPALLLCPLVGVPVARAALSGAAFGLLIAAGITTWAVPASLRYFALDGVTATAFALLVWLVSSALPYGALAGAFAWLTRRVAAPYHAALAAWLWVLVEMARSSPPLGLPWGLLSHTQWSHSWIVQIADIGGAYAVTAVVVFASTTAGLACRDWITGGSPRDAAWRTLPAALAVALTLGYGAATVAARARAEAALDGLPVAVVQGDGSDGTSWRRVGAELAIVKYLRLSAIAEPQLRPGALIVWPENAVDLYLEREPLLLARVGALARRSGADLLVGAPRLHADGAAHNSAVLIGPDGQVRAAYDKRVLVPLAEAGLPWPGDAVAADPRYTGGSPSGPLPASGFALGTVICFESLFPQLVRDAVRRGADLLVNISNDSWLDDGSGTAPRQHFAMSVLRAIETRRYLVRASAGGMSGFVSPLGRVYATVEWGRAGAAVGRVEPRTEITPYVRWGETWVAVLGLVVGIGWLAGTSRALR